MKAGKGAGESGAGGAAPRRPGRPPDPAETMEEEEGCKLWPIRLISARGAAFLPSLRR